MKLIDTIPMGGGYDYALKVDLTSGLTKVYFITDEGISEHPTLVHLDFCLTKGGFSDFLEIKAKAIPTAELLLSIPQLPDYLVKYLEDKVVKWQPIPRTHKIEIGLPAMVGISPGIMAIQREMDMPPVQTYTSPGLDPIWDWTWDFKIPYAPWDWWAISPIATRLPLKHTNIRVKHKRK